MSLRLLVQAYIIQKVVIAVIVAMCVWMSLLILWNLSLSQKELNRKLKEISKFILFHSYNFQMYQKKENIISFTNQQ